MKTAFIIPKDDSQPSQLSQFAQCRVLPPVGLARMAGQAGKHGIVTIIDERLNCAAHNCLCDLAIIFVNSYNLHRAYTLATQFRNLGSLVIFTGPLLARPPADAYTHADCLFIGTGSDCLTGFLADFLHRKIKPMYYDTAIQIYRTNPSPILSTNTVRASL